MNTQFRTTTRIVAMLIRPIVLSVILWVGVNVAAVRAQDQTRCAAANAFLTDDLSMATRIDPDTLDDWRTGERLPACRITAAGARRTSLAAAARAFYERIRAAGWARTPDPRDAPNEASLRFRLGDTDCLFNVYQGILLGTDAEIEVTDTVRTRPGEALYHALVLCVPAMPARPRQIEASAIDSTASTRRAGLARAARPPGGRISVVATKPRSHKRAADCGADHAAHWSPIATRSDSRMPAATAHPYRVAVAW